MRKRIFSVISRVTVVVVLSIFLFASKGHCQDPQPFSLAIKSTRNVYAIDEVLSLQYELKNISKDKILLNKNIVPGGNLFFEIDKVRAPMKLFLSASWALDQDVDYLEPGQSIQGVWQEFKWSDDHYFQAGAKTITAYLQMYLKKNDKMEASSEIVSNMITVDVVGKKNLFKDLTKEEAIEIGQKIMMGLTFNKSKYDLRDVFEVKEKSRSSWQLLFDLEEKQGLAASTSSKITKTGISVYVDKATGKATIVSED